MNLHELKKTKHPHNVAILDLDWNPGFVIIVDDDYPCTGEGRECYANTNREGHGQNCLHRVEGAQPWLREHHTSQGTYLCECECHKEDNIAVFGTYIQMRTQEVDARYINATMWGEVFHEETNDYVRRDEDPGYRRYWCHPCRTNEHHWTE